MALDFAHGFAVEYFFAAGGAFVEFEGGDNVSFAFEVSGVVAADFFDLVAAAGWTGGDFHFFVQIQKLNAGYVGQMQSQCGITAITRVGEFLELFEVVAAINDAGVEKR